MNFSRRVLTSAWASTYAATASSGGRPRHRRARARPPVGGGAAGRPRAPAAPIAATASSPRRHADRDSSQSRYAASPTRKNARGDVLDAPAGRPGDARHVRPVHEEPLRHVTASDVLGDATVHQAPRLALAFGSPGLGRDGRDGLLELAERSLVRLDRAAELPRCVLQVPPGADLDEAVDAGHELVEQRRLEGTDLSLDRLPPAHRPGHVAGDPVRAHDVRGLRTGLGDHPGHERDPLGVDDVVRDEHRDELASQRVLVQQRPEPLDDRRREVGAEVALEVLGVGERRGQQGVGEAHLRVARGARRARAASSRRLERRRSAISSAFGSASSSRSSVPSASSESMRSSNASIRCGESSVSWDRIWACWKLSYRTWRTTSSCDLVEQRVAFVLATARPAASRVRAGSSGSPRGRRCPRRPSCR